MKNFKKYVNYYIKISVLGLLIILSNSQATTYFVNSSASVSGTGLSWSSPKTTITAAISTSGAGDVILVKYGTYPVTSAIMLTSNRMITSDDGNGTGWDDANPDSSLCIIAGNGSKRIIYMTGSSVTNATRIRGFKITGGNATTESTMITAGGGMLLLYGASPIIENCWITGNVAASTNQNVQSSGGGICSWYAGSNPIIRYNYFYNNIALTNSGSSAGGAIYANVGSVPEIYGNIFRSNKAAVGAGNGIYPNYAGAVYVDDGSPKIYNNIFEGNIALERTISWDNAPWGAIVGAGAIETGTGCNAYIVNNLFKNNISLNCPNSSKYTGTGSTTSAGAVSATASSVIMNNTFVGNFSRSQYAYNASVSAGGLKNYSSNATVKNNIFVDHPSYGGAAFMGGTITITNNAFYNNSVNYTSNGTITSLNEINADPRFVAASGGNYQLSEASPCVNAGDPNTNVTAFQVDLANNNRKKGGTIDIGAYEYQSDDPPFITSAASVVVTEDVYFSYHIVAEDDTDAEVTLSVDNLPVWLHADADSIFGVATEGTADTSFRIIASDGTLNDTLLVSVDVVLINDLPVISEISNIKVYSGEVISPVAFTVFDEETALDELQITFLSSAGVLIPVDSISISGSGTERIIHLKPVTGKIGVCDITVQLNDGGQTVTEQFRVTILKPNSAPGIYGTPSVSVYENAPYYFGFRITDSDGDPVTFSAIFPGWLTLDSVSAAMSVIAGNGVYEFNGNEKPATSAAIGSVQDVAVDKDGNIYIVESSNYRVCKITPDGIIHDFAGNGSYGNSGDGGPAVNAQFKSIFAVAADLAGNVYIADASDNRIRVVATDGIISHFAGTAASSGFAGDGEAASTAKLNSPRDIFIDAENNMYIADSGNNRIRKIDSNGIITTVAGYGYSSFGGDGGPAVNAYLKLPTGVCLDADGNMYIADMWNNRVRKVDTNGIISTFAGSGVYSSTGDGGLAVDASMYYPQGVVADNAGNVFVSVQQSKNVRKIDSDGIITTAIGTGSGEFGSISLSSPNGLCIDRDGHLLIADVYNYRVRKLAFPYYDLRGTPGSDNIGNHLVSITANDGMASNFLEFNLEVLNVNDPPLIISSSAVTATEDQSFSYVGLASDPDDSLFIWQFRDIPGWLTADADSIFGIPLQGDGDTSFVVMVSDGEYRDTLTVAVTVIPVNDRPVITSAASVSATEDQRFVYRIMASDEENDRLYYTCAKLPRWLSADADSVFGTPLEADGDTSFLVIVSDGQLRDSLTVNIQVLSVNDRPVIISSTAVTATEDQSFSYVAQVSDPDDSLFSWQFVDYPSWLTVKNDSIYGTPTQNDTSCVFMLIVSDGECFDTANVSITLMFVNDRPVITSTGAVQATEDIYFIYTCTAIDEENDSLNYSFSQLPRWLSADADSVFGTPLEADGDTSFLVIVSDQSGNDSLTVTVHVIAVNDPPLFSTIPDTGFAEDDKLILRLSSLKNYVTDPDTPDSSLVIDIYSISPLTVDIQNDSILVSAEANWFGVDTIRLIVRDDILSDTTQFALTVYPVNDAPVFSDLMPDSLILNQGEIDSIFVEGLARDIDTPDSLLNWSAVAGKFVNCQWLDSLKQFQVSVNPDTFGIDTIYIIVSDGEFRIDAAITVIVNPSAGLDNNAIELPKTYALKQNYPNPFNPTTIIPYDIPQESHVDIRIYDLRGREVVTLIQRRQAVNHYRISWDGRDKHGNPVASGVYLYRMLATAENQQYSRTRKLIIVQ